MTGAEIPHFYPPARRSTDRFIGLGFTGLAVFSWIVVIRVAWTGDMVAALAYAVPAALITVAALGILRLLWLHWRGKKAHTR